MSGVRKVLAIDLGASSGRAILAAYDGAAGTLSTEEVHRFENVPVEKDGTLRWDIDALTANIREGAAKAGAFESVSVDTWGVDFALSDAEGRLIEAPVHYRDRRTEGVAAQVIEKIGAETLYRRTGNQFLDLNTLFQLVALKRDAPEVYEKTATILFMPDYFNYTLGGRPVSELTISSTSQALNPLTRRWDTETLSALGLDVRKFAPLVPSGTVIGERNGVRVVAAAGHDTQCAVAAIPTDRTDVAFLSCGTWSVLGTELDEPILTRESLDASLSNEIGANGKINYLQNIIGLWLIQESRREWRRRGTNYTYGELEKLAGEAAPLRSFIDPDAPAFNAPGDMPERIRAYCRTTGQPVPETAGEITRCIYESLALRYRLGLERMSAVTGKTFAALHLIGGGAQSATLCRFTADCCELPVVAGPVEATALGNIVIQLTALGAVPNLNAGRALIGKAEKIVRYEGRPSEDWRDAYRKFKRSLK